MSHGRQTRAMSRAMGDATPPATPSRPDFKDLLPRPSPRRNSPAQDERGHFLSTALPPAVPAVSERTLLKFRDQPFYIEALGTENPFVLPTMQKVLDLRPEEYTPRLWDAHNEALPHTGIAALLDSIGLLLQDTARRITRRVRQEMTHSLLPGHQAFATPLAPLDACMLVDYQKVATTEGMFVHDSGYVLVSLGREAWVKGQGIREYAHRIVVWSMHGGPPPDIQRPVVMHVCNNPACLHPEHMVWGEDEENWGPRAHVEAARRRMQQRFW